MASIPPYTALLPTILCQQPAVILHWLKTERATGNLPVEIVLDVLIELASRQTNNVHSVTLGPTGRALVNGVPVPTIEERLEVYKHALNLMRTYTTVIITPGCDCDECNLASKVMDALHAVDKLEGK